MKSSIKGKVERFFFFWNHLFSTVFYLWESTSLVKLYYQRNENCNAALREFWRLKKLRKRPTSITNLQKLYQCFETTVILVQQVNQAGKITSQQQVDEFTTSIVEQEIGNVQDTSSARLVSWQYKIDVYYIVWHLISIYANLNLQCQNCS